MKATKVYRLYLALTLASAIVLASCGGATAVSSTGDGGDTIAVRYADNLSLIDHGGYVEAVVRNPWDTTRTLQTYLLVPADADLPSPMTAGTVLRVPLTNALVYSTVHNALIDDIGAVDAIGGVCNSQYINVPGIKDAIASGHIADCGNSMTPNIERIIELHPQAILLSPFENNDRYGKVADLGIPIVECADYMESSPLGRAEWVKFYGLLFGREAVADSMFSATESQYVALKKAVENVDHRPRVLIDQRYGQVWNVPGGNSTMARFIADAGGINPFDSHYRSGSVALSPEQVLATAHDADVWLVRYNQADDKTLRELADDSAVNDQFEAFRRGNVYGCNTRYVDFYEEVPFHPEWLLRDMIDILHPGLLDEAVAHKYYSPMRP